ncbi:MAG: hypothetical protein Q8P03_01800 [bacterium]|nr:hypothetical protein [bacterium]
MPASTGEHYVILDMEISPWNICSVEEVEANGVAKLIREFERFHPVHGWVRGIERWGVHLNGDMEMSRRYFRPATQEDLQERENRATQLRLEQVSGGK